ncbi:hypothetical protein [Zeimonas arvi]|uniref:hypothetical protein n=1 Tax=Zeimonas arvi TaxID=2498847 RepID=UPI0016502B8D|nr:hypothetical protein [Zeimonas arvi]
MTITNRSRFVASVKNNEALRLEFPFDKAQGKSGRANAESSAATPAAASNRLLRKN